MLGNDIIDIALTKKSSDWTRSGWLDKICTLKEQEIILRSEDPFQMVWRIWSMKESAYKVSIQKGFEYAFNPSYFETQIFNNIIGEVSFGELSAETETSINKDYIHSVATIRYNGLPQIYTGIIVDPKILKLELLKQASLAYAVSFDDLEIRYTEERVPYIFNVKMQLHSPISMSHHGNYGAYVFYKQDEDILQ